MSALKFDVLDLIREPDNYTSGERAKASEAIAELIEASASLLSVRAEFRAWSALNPKDESVPRHFVQRMAAGHHRLSDAVGAARGAA